MFHTSTAYMGKYHVVLDSDMSHVAEIANDNSRLVVIARSVDGLDPRPLCERLLGTYRARLVGEYTLLFGYDFSAHREAAYRVRCSNQEDTTYVLEYQKSWETAKWQVLDGLVMLIPASLVH